MTALPLAPVERLVGHGDQHENLSFRDAHQAATARSVALALNVCRGTVQRWRREGLSAIQADRVAIHLGLHPLEIWPEWADMPLPKMGRPPTAQPSIERHTTTMTTTSTTDHLTVAIEDVDTQIAALNIQIDQMRDRVDTLVDARVQLVAARTAIAWSSIVPLAEPATPPASRSAPAAKKSAPARRQAKQTGSKYDLNEVARIAKAATAAGRPMGQAVLDGVAECPTIAMAGFLIQQARAAGHDIPSRRSGVPAARKSTPEPSPASTAHVGPRNTPYVRPDADTVATMEREAGLA